jgi:hypothetical protein
MSNPTPSTAFNISSAINLRADSFCVATTLQTCRHCGHSTRLVAVVLPPGHEVLEWDDDAIDDEIVDDEIIDDEIIDDHTESHADSAGTWQVAAQPAFLFHIAYLPEHVQRRMCAATAYSVERGAPADESCWANHCEHCGAYFDDQELFCEPGGAFCPASVADARSIELRTVDEPIGVDAAGYAQQPEFFDAMNRA